MASLSTCHLGLWLGWQILLNLVKSLSRRRISNMFNIKDKSPQTNNCIVTCMPKKTNRRRQIVAERRDVYAGTIPICEESTIYSFVYRNV